MFLKYFFSRLAAKSDDMTFWEHAEVLRIHLIRIFLALVLFSTGAFFFKDFLFNTIICGPLDKYCHVDVSVAGCTPKPEAIVAGIAQAAEILKQKRKEMHK